MEITSELKELSLRVAEHLIKHERGDFLLSVASGQLLPEEEGNNWLELKKKVVDGNVSDDEIKQLVLLSSHHPFKDACELYLVWK
ncbi:hypothetical protein [Moritella dasanensis]|uniref:hypothetical protein n=1 Tax=Moritella dasanensis TaxID=428031 RepID=UPI0002FBD702|nr:hypothetical protein [Moritella dasanensis]